MSRFIGFGCICIRTLHRFNYKYATANVNANTALRFHDKSRSLQESFLALELRVAPCFMYRKIIFREKKLFSSNKSNFFLLKKYSFFVQKGLPAPSFLRHRAPNNNPFLAQTKLILAKKVVFSFSKRVFFSFEIFCV